MTSTRAPSRRLAVRFGIPAAVLVASALYAGVPNDSSACTCACLGSPEEELEAYGLVFHGRVSDIRNAFGCGSRVILEFEVLEGFRGAEAGDRVGVSARSGDGGDCRVADAYEVGDELVLFTDAANPWLSLCHPRVRAPEGQYNACATDTGDPDLTFDEVVAALEAATD